MITFRILVPLTLVALLGIVSAVNDANGEGYNRRLTSEERREVFKSMEERRKIKAKEACSASSSSAEEAFPAMPKSFITQMEISFQDNYTIITGEEKFDGLLNTGVLKYRLVEGIFLTRPDVFEQVIYYSTPADTADFIYGNNACHEEGGENCDPGKFCVTGNIKDLTGELQAVFGFLDANIDKGYMGAASILQWGPALGYASKGAIDCRSMQCRKFETCIKSESTGDMVIFTYYWSSPDWTLNTNHYQVPVAVEIISIGTVNPIVRPVNIRFDFYDFLYDIAPDVDALMPPVDVYCYGRKSLYEPPRVPHYFSYKSEAIASFDILVNDGDNQTKVVTFTSVINQEEYYDWDAKISRAEYLPWFLQGEENRWEYKTYVVHDFHQGLQYSLQKHLGTCQTRLIENITTIGDVVVNPDGSVEMRPPWIFEDMDEPMQYNGVHWTRGIAADVWIGTKKLPGGKLNETIVWYYASPFMEDEDVGRRNRKLMQSRSSGVKEYVSMDRVPVRVEKYLNIFSSLPHGVFNIYSYDDEPPMTHDIDISDCYIDDQMISFIFELPPDSISKVEHLRDKLKYAIMTVLAEFGMVSPLRINRLVLEERTDTVRVLFSILDKPKVEGDGADADLESSMQEAADKISDGLSKQQIIILVPMSNDFQARAEPVYVAIVPLSRGLTSVTRGSTNTYMVNNTDGFSSGSMAGLAIGMLILGGLVGVAICMILKQRGGTSSGLPRVSIAKKSSEMPRGSVYLGGDMTGGSDI